jgi:hypothetical protein
MDISAAQRENRIRFCGGFYGQLVSGLLWLASAALATWSTPRSAITMLVVSGFFIFPITELLVRLHGRQPAFSPANSLPQLGMQTAFVLPLSMLLLIPVGHYRLSLFYPALTILLGAHYIPFVFLYGMRSFGFLAGLLVGGGVLFAMYLPGSFNACAWYTGAVLLVFAGIGKAVAQQDHRAGAIMGRAQPDD